MKVYLFFINGNKSTQTQLLFLIKITNPISNKKVARFFLGPIASC